MEDGVAAAVAGVRMLAPSVAVGVAFGVTAERLHLCTMGAVADVVVFNSWRRARIWATMTAVAAVALSVLALAGLVDVAATAAWRHPSAALSLLGGLVYGVGMVVAGGCLSRAWLRAAAGSGEAVVLVALALAVAVPLSALLPESRPLATSPTPWPPALAALLVAGGLALGVLGDARFRGLRGAWRTPSLLGALAALALVMAPTTTPALGVSFAPLAGADAHAVALLAGIVLGAAGSAVQARRWRWERPAWREPGRRITGAVALGVGAALVGGGSVAIGVTGVAIVAPTALLALVGMVIGAALAVKAMLAGGPGALLRDLAAGAGWRG